jgi:hypothetical protein
MASNYTGLGIQLMTTGEKAGLWGGLTNTNWNIMEQISGGYTTQAVTDGADTDLAVADGATGATLANRIIELTGSLTSGRNVTIPLDVEQFYIIKNATTGSQIVTFKYVTGSGSSVAIANGATVLVYATANDVTNPDIVDTGFSTTTGDVTLTGTQTLTNKTLTSPKIGTAILDTAGAELFKLTATGSAVNEFTVANAATGGAPSIAVTSSTDTNADFTINPLGTGRVTLGAAKIKQVAENCTIDATAATGTINYDVVTQAVWYFTTAASGNWTLNIRGDGSTTLDSIMDTGESVTIAHLVTQTGTAYYNNVVTVDGGANTPEWQGGTAPSEGNINSVDVYTYTVVKTGSAAFTVFASQTQFA